MEHCSGNKQMDQYSVYSTVYVGRNGSKRKANIQTVSNNSKSMFLWWSELRSVHFFQPNDHGFNPWSCRSVPMITNDARQWSLHCTPTTPNMLLVYENKCKSRLCYIQQSPVQVDEQKKKKKHKNVMQEHRTITLMQDNMLRSENIFFFRTFAVKKILSFEKYFFQSTKIEITPFRKHYYDNQVMIFSKYSLM